MAWTLGLDNLRGPADDEDVGSAHPSSESLYYGPPQNGTRREWGVPPRNGRNLPPTMVSRTGIGGRLPQQPILNGATRLPWHNALNGTTNQFGVALPNGFGRPLNPEQFGRGQQEENEDG